MPLVNPLTNTLMKDSKRATIEQNELEEFLVTDVVGIVMAYTKYFEVIETEQSSRVSVWKLNSIINASVQIQTNPHEFFVICTMNNTMVVTNTMTADATVCGSPDDVMSLIEKELTNHAEMQSIAVSGDDCKFVQCPACRDTYHLDTFHTKDMRTIFGEVMVNMNVCRRCYLSELTYFAIAREMIFTVFTPYIYYEEAVDYDINVPDPERCQNCNCESDEFDYCVQESNFELCSDYTNVILCMTCLRSEYPKYLQFAYGDTLDRVS